jgi:hypothetical protein
MEYEVDAEIRDPLNGEMVQQAREHVRVKRLLWKELDNGNSTASFAFDSDSTRSVARFEAEELVREAFGLDKRVAVIIDACSPATD